MIGAAVAGDDRYAGTTTAADANDRWLVGRSGSELRFYDRNSGAVTMTLPLVEGGAFKIALDGRALYYADSGAMRRFPLDHAELAALARTRAKRELTAEECERYVAASGCVAAHVQES